MVEYDVYSCSIVHISGEEKSNELVLLLSVKFTLI